VYADHFNGKSDPEKVHPAMLVLWNGHSQLS